jgi:hypothetical protein
LALDDDQWHALAGHLDGVGVSKLVRREPNRWMSSREAAEYAGTTRHALHKAMAAREVHFEQDVPGGKAWFRRADIDAWRRGERPRTPVRRAA